VGPRTSVNVMVKKKSPNPYLGSNPVRPTFSLVTIENEQAR
jgi:hypothetical protein